jgi:vacuolar-type H+-ATPase subunit H
MIEEHLSRIRSKEEGSKARIAAVEGEAAAVIEKAHEEGRRHLDEVKMSAAELERSLLAAARRKADARISELRADNAKRLAALAVLAKKNQEKAIEMILRKFREGI